MAKAKSNVYMLQTFTCGSDPAVNFVEVGSIKN